MFVREMPEPSRRLQVPEKRERRLRAEIKQARSPERIRQAAEALRAAMLSFCKGQRMIALFSEEGEEQRRHLERLQAKAEHWANLRCEQVVVIYDEEAR